MNGNLFWQTLKCHNLKWFGLQMSFYFLLCAFLIFQNYTMSIHLKIKKILYIIYIIIYICVFLLYVE